MKYKTVLFDLDGTLLDTLEDMTDALNRTMRLHGLPERTPKEVRSFVGNGARRLIELAAEGVDGERFEQILSDYKKDYDENYLIKTAPYPGILELLKTLPSKRRQDRRGVQQARQHRAGALRGAVSESGGCLRGRKSRHPQKARAGHRPRRHGAAWRHQRGHRLCGRLRGGHRHRQSRRDPLHQRDLGLP